MSTVRVIGSFQRLPVIPEYDVAVEYWREGRNGQPSALECKLARSFKAA